MTKTEAIRNSFISKFEIEPLMVFSPGRVNLIGEHTDYNDGFVLPGAINLGFTVAIGKSDSQSCHVIAYDLDEHLTFTLETVHASENNGWENYVLGLVFELQKSTTNLSHFNLVFGSDLPDGAGLSSSAAMLNGIGMALNLQFDLSFSPIDLVKASQAAEHNFVGLECGIMDQFASMFGKERHLIFLDCQSLSSELIPFELDDHEILLINSNVKHKLADSAYNERRQSCFNVARKLGQSTLRMVSFEDLEQIKRHISSREFEMAHYVLEENRRVKKAVSAIIENDLKQLGILMYKSHDGLKSKYQVSCEELDFLVEMARENGFLGARMMGGGFGGCTINLVQKTDSQKAKESISNAYFNKFNKECTFYHLTLSNGTHQIL